VPNLIRGQAPDRLGDEVAFGMCGRIAIGCDRILRREENRSVQCQQRPERVIAGLPSAARQLDRLPYETFVEVLGVHVAHCCEPSLSFHSPLPQCAGGRHRQPVTRLPGDHYDLTAMMRFVCDEIRQHMADIEREIPPHVAFGRRKAAICREPEFEESFDAGAAAFQRGYELPRRHLMVIDASGRRNAVFTSQRLNPPASGVVEMRSDGADSTLRRTRNRELPQRPRQFCDELARHPVVRPPRANEVRFDSAC
jgi:hypothetical protein